eukprot:393962-Rhodomonas_salina.1
MDTVTWYMDAFAGLTSVPPPKGEVMWCAGCVDAINETAKLAEVAWKGEELLKFASSLHARRTRDNSKRKRSSMH